MFTLKRLKKWLYHGSRLGALAGADLRFSEGGG